MAPGTNQAPNAVHRHPLYCPERKRQYDRRGRVQARSNDPLGNDRHDSVANKAQEASNEHYHHHRSLTDCKRTEDLPTAQAVTDDLQVAADGATGCLALNAATRPYLIDRWSFLAPGLDIDLGLHHMREASGLDHGARSMTRGFDRLRMFASRHLF